MNKLLILMVLFLCCVVSAYGRARIQGDCMQGNHTVTVQGLSSITKVMQSYPVCTVTVYINGGGIATIYSDNVGTLIPGGSFASDATGHWGFYADNGRYDVVLSGAGIIAPFTLWDHYLLDLAQPTGTTAIGNNLTVAGYSAFCGAALHNTVATGYVGIFCDKLWTNTDNEVRGIHATVRNKRTVADGAWDFFALSGATEVTADNTQHITGQMKGVIAELYFQPPAAGVYIVDKAVGVQSNIPTLGVGATVTDWYGLAVNAPPVGGTITTGRGLWVENLNAYGNAPTTSYAIKLDGLGNYGRIAWQTAGVDIQETTAGHLRINSTIDTTISSGLIVGVGGTQGVDAGSYAIGGATIITAAQNINVTGNVSVTGAASHFVTKRIATPAAAAAGSLRVFASATDTYMYSEDDAGVVTGMFGTIYIAVENGVANAIACAAWSGPTLAVGLQVNVLLAHTLQAGANTFAYNGGAAKAIKSHRNVANDIGVAYATGGVITILWDGTQWLDMSQ